MDAQDVSLSELETAANAMMSPPFAVSDEQRKAAEQLFIKLQKLKHPYQVCKHILEGSQSEYVIFQAACALKGAIVREWNMLSAHQLEELRLYLLQYTANHATLVGYAREQLVHVLAVIVKRRTLESDKKLLFDSVFSEVTQLLAMDPPKQRLGCSLLSAILVEYSSSSGSSAVGLTWEFHFHCKRAIETEELLRILLFGVQVLEQYVSVEFSSLSDEATKLLLNFVKLTSQVLNWHFCHTHPLGVAFSVAEMTNVSFKPPKNWSSTILDPSFLQLFFKLLTGYRNHEDLLHHTFQCLSQMASLRGAVFESDKDRALYITVFASELLEYIKNINFSSSNLSGQEIHGTAGVVYRLVTTFPTSTILTMEREKLTNFTEILAQATCMCAQKASEISSDDDSGFFYHESFDQLLNTWMHLLVDSDNFPPNFFHQPCCDIFQSYLGFKLAPPTGWRTCSSEDDDVLCDVQEDDRIVFSEQLSSIGYIARNVPEYSLPLLLNLIEECVTKFATQYSELVSQQTVVRTESPQLHSLYEDIHWLFLITSYLLNDILQGELVSIPSKLMEYMINLETQDIQEFDMQTTIMQQENCRGRNVNHILALLACACRWCQLEKLYISAGMLSYLSPQVTSTITWMLAKAVDSYLLFKESDYQQVSVTLASALGNGTVTGQWLVSFLIDKLISNFTVWSSDQSVADSSVELLSSMAKNSSAAVVAMDNNLLWSMMRSFVTNQTPLSQLPCTVQRKLMCNLILLATGSRKELFLTQLLEPLQQRLKFLLQRYPLKTLSKEPGVKTELLSIIECLCGVGLVSKASLVHNFIVFFQPVLVTLVEVFDAFSNCQEVMVIILELFSIIAENYITFLNEKDSSHLYQVSLSLLQCYSRCSASRYEKNTFMDEEQCEDLLLCLKLLTNLTTKEFLDFSEPSQESGNGVQSADVVLYGLGLVIPLMNAELLKFPNLCEQFFTFVKFACDMYAEQLFHSTVDLYQAVFHLVKTGTVEFDSNISKLSMEAVASLAAHCCSQPTCLQVPYIKESLQDYLRLLLEYMLSDACGMDLTISVSSALFALVCAQQEFYTTLVESLVAGQNNNEYKERLLVAFKKLTPPTLPLSLSRRHKIQFRRNLEEFLTAVKGFMCVK